MRAETLLYAIGEVDEQAVQAARQQKKPRHWRHLAVVAACVCVVVLGIWTAQRFEYLTFRTGCSAWVGDVVDGDYYYRVAHKGLYRYSPDSGETEKVLSAFWFDGYLVNEYGVYYNDGKSLYVMPFDTEKRTRLYRAGWNCTHIGFSLYGDDVVVTVYNKRTEQKYELLLEGRSGAVLETTPCTDYDTDALLYWHSHFRLGERELELAATGEEGRYDLRENGVSLLPEGVTVGAYPHRFGDSLWFYCTQGEETSTCFLVSPTGERLVELPTRNYLAWGGDFALYLWDGDGDGIDDQLYCIDLRTGEEWALPLSGDAEWYDLTCDGQYLYACVPWDEYQACWRLVWQQGRPAAAELVSGDIRE